MKRLMSLKENFTRKDDLTMNKAQQGYVMDSAKYRLQTGSMTDEEKAELIDLLIMFGIETLKAQKFVIYGTN